MGNCVFKGFAKVEEMMVKVVTSNGGVMELCAPITAESITNEFPGHAIFKTRDLFSPPLLHNEELMAGESYYLLPLATNKTTVTSSSSSSSVLTPYRMSFDNQRLTKRASEEEVIPRYNSNYNGGRGVWKVKLVISPQQLSEILAQEARTEALIESVRTVAKCGNATPSVANSDQWSLSSSWKASSENCALEM